MHPVKCQARIQQVDDRQTVVLLKLHSRKVVVTGNHPNDLDPAGIFRCELADTASLLLAPASPARTELKKDGHAFIILGFDLAAEYVV